MVSTCPRCKQLVVKDGEDKTVVKAGWHNNKQYLKCDECSRIFTLDKTDKKHKFNESSKFTREDLKKIYNFSGQTSIKEQYIKFLKVWKRKYKNKKPPSISYIYKLTKGLIKRTPRYERITCKTFYPISVISSTGKKVKINVPVSICFSIHNKKAYKKMEELKQILKERKISHKKFIERHLLKGGVPDKKGIFKAYKNEWSPLHEKLNKKKVSINDKAIQLLNDIIILEHT